MKRLVFFAVAQAMMLGAAWAQNAVEVRVVAPPCGRFYVDGKLYEKAATFLWTLSSWHKVVPAQSYNIANDIMCNVGTSLTSEDNNQPAPTNQMIYVGGPNTYTLASSYSYRLRIVVNNGTGTPPCNCNEANNATVSGVYVNGACHDHDKDLWMDGGTAVTAAVKPPPGWSFIGWDDPAGFRNQPSPIAVTMNGPILVRPIWRPAGHFTVTSDPPGMKVLVDQTAVATPATFEWAPGSTHALSPLSPQDKSLKGDHWVFWSWSDNGPENRTITAPDPGRWADLSVKYVQGAKTSFGTIPMGLTLSIDGRSNWPSYNFIWGVGSKHRISAPLDQSDGKGRRYVFRQWTIGGAAEQDFTVKTTGPQNPVNAIYDVLGQLVINSSVPNARILVDGTGCLTPCAVNRSPGSEVKISAPATIAVGDNERLDFEGWADGGPAERVWKATNEGLVLTANYRASYRIRAASDPAGGSGFRFEPPSADGFYPAGTAITITAEPKPGYKFRNWDGMLQLAPSINMTASGPLSVMAVLDSYAFLGADSVRNAAAETPEPHVAPGSIIAITGANLAPRSENGPDNPLAQAIAGVTVQVGDRMLPLFAVSREQITAQLPSGISEGEHTLTVHQDGEPDVAATFTVKRNAPGLFTRPEGDKPYALAVHDDGKPVTAENPAQHGETITLLGTGFGPAKPAPLDGFILPQDPKTAQYPLVDPVEIRVGDKTVLKPVSSQAAKGYIGVSAIRLKITEEMPAGTTIELRAAVKDPADKEGKTFHESNNVLLPLK